MRRFGLMTALVTMLALMGSAAALASTGSAAAVALQAGGHLRRERFSGPITLRGNRADARADARYLVALVKLPAGTVKESAPRRPQAIESVFTHRLAAARYLVPATAGNPYAYVLAHRPGGVKNDLSGSGSGPGGSDTMLGYSFPDIRGRLFARELQVTFTKLKDGNTRVLVEAQSNWIVPRPRDTRVPRAAKQVQVATTTTSPTVSSGSSSSPITSPGTVRKLIKLVNALPLVPDEAIACPLDPPTAWNESLTLTYAAANGDVLATFSASWPKGQPDDAGWFCNPFNLKLTTGHSAELTGSSFLRNLQRLVGKAALPLASRSMAPAGSA